MGFVTFFIAAVLISAGPLTLYKLEDGRVKPCALSSTMSSLGSTPRTSGGESGANAVEGELKSVEKAAIGMETCLKPLETTYPGGTILKNGRLPSATKPLSYDLTVAVDLDSSKLAGIVSIDVEVLEPTSEVVFHSDSALRWLEGKVKMILGEEDLLLRHEFFPAEQAVKLIPTRMLVTGNRVRIEVEFSSKFSEKLVGFYRAKYTDAGKTKFLGVTHLWPTEARRLFPCYDEPAQKAEFSVRIQRPANLTALGNMPVESSVTISKTLLDQEGNFVQDNFSKSPKMSTYLLALALSDFGNVQSSSSCDKSDSTECAVVRIWMPASSSNQGHLAASVSPKILKFYEQLFDIPYPLPKMDLFVAPDLAYGAMENWGLITYRAQRLLFDAHVSTAEDQIGIVSTIAHEISHQWFGNLVTPTWWTDLWLNEGFASYMEVIPIQVLFPEWKVGEILFSQKLRGVLVTDALRASHPISKLDVETTDEIIELFDDISYRKGSSLIRMIVSIIGKEAFFKALSKYLKAFAYGNASQDDLWHYLSTAQGEFLPPGVTLKEVMDSWTLKTGFPLVTVTRNDTGQLSFSQHRFLAYDPECSARKEKSTWWIPINYVIGSTTSKETDLDWSNAQPEGWLSASSALESVQTKEDEWIVVNVGHTGYYRVNYDEANWRRLAAQLKTNHSAIDVVNRAQIVDDVLTLAKAGYVDYSVALDVVGYLPQERAYLPLSAAFRHFKFFLDMTDSDERVEKYVLNTILPALDEVTFASGGVSLKPGQVYEDLATIWFEGLLLKWGSKLGHEKTRAEGLRQFTRWVTGYNVERPDASTEIQPNNKEAVYCSGVRGGSDQSWKFAAAHYSRTTVASEKELVLTALACTTDPSTMQNYVDGILDKSGKTVDKADAITALLAVADTSAVGRRHLLDAITNRWDDVSWLFGSGRTNVGRIFVALSQAAYLEQDLEKVHAFGLRHANSDVLHGAGMLMQIATELLSANIDWRAKRWEEFLNAVNKINS